MYAYEKKDPYTFSFTSADELRLYIQNNGLNIPFSTDLSPLAAKKELRTRGGHITLQNSLTVHPMEGFDGEPDGSPSALSRRRYLRFARSGAAQSSKSRGCRHPKARRTLPSREPPAP